MRHDGRSARLPRRLQIAVLVVALLIAGCSQAAVPASTPLTRPDGDRDRTAGASAARRLVAAIQSDPGSLVFRVNPTAGGLPGLAELETLVGSGLGVIDDQGTVRPLLADEIPSLENGLWTVEPDGRMRTTWIIRKNARWHDGTPFTSEDLRFTAAVMQDRQLDVLRDIAFESVEGIEASDGSVIAVSWLKPYIRANALFNPSPLPVHLLGATYAESKATFTQLTYWTQDYVGTGPFRLREFVPGSHAMLVANDDYAAGRPRIDEVEVKFIGDPGALAVNILAGGVDVSLGRTLSLDQALEVRDQWSRGRVDFPLLGWLVVFPQFIDPTPSAILDLRFRRALLHAVDRKQMADSLMHGFVPVAHTFLSPADPQYPAIEASLVRYDYNIEKATGLLREMGYTRGADGAFRDRANQKITAEIRATAGRDINTKTIFAVADDWQRFGIAAESLVVPQQRVRDREYVQAFPGFLLFNQPTDIDSLNRLRSSQTPLPENNFVGRNNSRYMNPEFDTLIDRHFSTVSQQERVRELAQVLRYISEQLTMMGIFYNTEPAFVAGRLDRVTVKRGDGAVQTWNVHEWQLGL